MAENSTGGRPSPSALAKVEERVTKSAKSVTETQLTRGIRACWEFSTGPTRAVTCSKVGAVAEDQAMKVNLGALPSSP